MKKQIFYGIFLNFIFFAAQIQGAVTLDNTSSNGASDTITGMTSLSWSHTVNSCTNCVLYVSVSTFTQTNFATARVLNVTYGTQTLTNVGTQVSPFPNLPAVGNSSVELFRLIAPVTGTATVTVNFLIPVNYAVGGANSFNGVSQTTPNSAFFSSSGNSAMPSLTASDGVVGDLVLDVLGTTPNSLFVVPDVSQTELYNGRPFFSFAFDVGAGSAKSPVSLTTPMNWTITNSSIWALGAITIKQHISTSSLASISGQIRTKSGTEISGSTIILQNLLTGDEIRTFSNEKGFYRFEDLEISRLYRVRIINKNYRFPLSEQIINLMEDVENFDFIGTER